jgi:thiosulfate reductase cytochrome b subunit
MTPGSLRRAQRRAHLLGGLLLIAYVYAPLEPQIEDLVRFVVVPVVVLTGVAMWQAARFRRILRERKRNAVARAG